MQFVGRNADDVAVFSMHFMECLSTVRSLVKLSHVIHHFETAYIFGPGIPAKGEV